jgi:light-regulated signal transduction histidine kinase (bacteriophytochrome)
VVSTYGELLRKEFGGTLGSTGEQYLEYIIQGALRMEHLLRDLRGYAQASTSELEPSEDIDANAVLDKVLTGLQSAIDENCAIVTNKGLPKIRFLEFQLEQLFQNLISNAIRYCSTDAPQIQVAASLENNEWKFSVQDNGIGIDPQYKEQVFGLFKRLHSNAEYPGTGMGLAICQRIVERAGGRIWVESELGRGSTFFFTIPCGAE